MRQNRGITGPRGTPSLLCPGPVLQPREHRGWRALRRRRPAGPGRRHWNCPEVMVCTARQQQPLKGPARGPSYLCTNGSQAGGADPTLLTSAPSSWQPHPGAQVSERSPAWRGVGPCGLAPGLREAWVSSPRWLAGSRHLCRVWLVLLHCHVSPSTGGGALRASLENEPADWHKAGCLARPLLREGVCGGHRAHTRPAWGRHSLGSNGVKCSPVRGRKGAQWVAWKPSSRAGGGGGEGGVCAESRQHPDLRPALCPAQ